MSGLVHIIIMLLTNQSDAKHILTCNLDLIRLEEILKFQCTRAILGFEHIQHLTQNIIKWHQFMS